MIRRSSAPTSAARLAAAPLALLALLASCQRGPPRRELARPAPRASADRPRPLPPALARLRSDIDQQAAALREAARALDAAVGLADAPRAREALAAVRRLDRALQPVARGMAPVASSQLGAYGVDPDEASPGTGLLPLGRLLARDKPPWDEARRSAAVVRRAAELLPGELAIQDWTLQTLGHALSEGVFAFGQRLDGSDSPGEGARAGDLRAEATGVLGAAVAVRDALVREGRPAAGAVDAEVTVLHSYLGALGPEPRGLLSLLRETGRLGASLRRGFVELGSAPIRLPFEPRRARGDALEPEVTVATFPRMGRLAPDPRAVLLGGELFAAPALSRGGDLACEGCHDPAFAFAAPEPRRTFDRRLPPRNAPGLWNVGYEVMYFWDGRASSLDAQIDIAVGRDMGGDWSGIEARVARDPALSARLRELSLGPPSAALIRGAIGAFEQSLVSDETPLDRFTRGDDGAISPLALAGFDLYFGKARCSRCHRLPLTSGLCPPRLLRTELSSIGVPRAPGLRALDPDPGRFATSNRPNERGLFKVPSLRNLPRTAPYFHNGAFATLEQVLAFYENGAGPGLGYEVPNVDPDLAPFTLTESERGALLAFLREGLSDLWALPPAPPSGPAPPPLP